MTKSNLGKVCLTHPGSQSTLGKPWKSITYWLALHSFAQSAFLHYPDHLPKGSRIIHSELGPRTSVIKFRTLNTFCSPKFQNASSKRSGTRSFTSVPELKGHSSPEGRALATHLHGPGLLFPALQKLKTCTSH